MIYPIIKFPDPVLTTPAAKVTEFGPELRQLVDDMFESMYAASGVGLAAPQIGRSLRLTVIDCSVGEDPAQKLV
ncbi:MAG: peptide deformylase, partial [Bryobacteraceae bacterium]